MYEVHAELGSWLNICSHLQQCSCLPSLLFPITPFFLQVYESKLQELQKQVEQIAETPDEEEEEEEEEEGKPLWKCH